MKSVTGQGETRLDREVVYKYIVRSWIGDEVLGTDGVCVSAGEVTWSRPTQTQVSYCFGRIRN